MTADQHTSTTAVGIGHAVVAGVVTAVVGFTSSFAVVLAGLRAVGASDDQAASGLLVLCLTMGAGTIVFSWRLKMPMTMAWSTPGAALLASSALPAHGFGAAVGAFAVTGALIALCGLIRPLGRLVSAIPPALANAMLAGVLLTLCVEPFRALAVSPAAIAPVLISWLVLVRVAPRWAVPGALLVAVVVIAVSGSFAHLSGSVAPALVVVAPVWHPATIVAIALPLFLVTMTSQNIPGMAVLASFGYRPPLAPPLLYTGAATVAGAFGGAHAINLAAISAALAAGPSAHPDPRRRWVAGVSCGVVYLAVIGPLSALVAAIAVAAPAGIMGSIAGLALIGAFASAAGSALADGAHREAAAITFLVAASGVTFGGVGAAFWGLLAGAGYLAVMRPPGRRGGRSVPDR